MLFGGVCVGGVCAPRYAVHLCQDLSHLQPTLSWTEKKRREFMEFLHDKRWKCEVQGPFDIGECFEYLKRKIDRTYEGFVIRPDPKHIEDIAQKADIKIGNYKKTPARSDLGKRDGSAELSGRCCTSEVNGQIASTPSTPWRHGCRSLPRRRGGMQSTWQATWWPRSSTACSSRAAGAASPCWT